MTIALNIDAHQGNGQLVRWPTTPKSFAFTSPYGGCWLEHYYRNAAIDLFGEKTKSEVHFRELLSRTKFQPELVIMGNFIVERHAIQSLCRQLDIDWICSEDGFFPHYETLHADPLGFAWESSLCRMIFRGLSDHQRRAAGARRIAWLEFQRQELPPCVKSPFVLWPLQLIGDRVNRWDLNVDDWSEMTVHFRRSLPLEYQLVLKPHPRAKANDQLRRALGDVQNVCLLPAHCDLRSLIEQSAAVAGANSTVLMEARLMFHKPVYTYARGWFTNHAELFIPMHMRMPSRELNRLDFLANSMIMRDEWLDDYTDWFLYQLMVRQFDREIASDWEQLHQWTLRRTHRAFLYHGEELFR